MENHSRDCLARRSAAAAELSTMLPGRPADRITNSLVFGLNTLRMLMFRRVHDDVESNLGRDSMLMPVSLSEAKQEACREIEAFQVAVSALEARQHGYLDVDWAWYLRWLAHLRLDEAARDDRWRRRIRYYLRMNEDQRRLEFSRHLERVFPEATRAPLILYRLFPLAIDIVSAIAYGEHLLASELRDRQAFWLPGIPDCRECHGRPLDNGEMCSVCGNPLWTYTWLCEEE
jgi:hypothetical protein